MSGESTGREAILAIMRSAPEHLDEIYSSGYSNLTYLDVEQRRLAQAADLLDLSLPADRGARSAGLPGVAARITRATAHVDRRLG